MQLIEYKKCMTGKLGFTLILLGLLTTFACGGATNVETEEVNNTKENGLGSGKEGVDVPLATTDQPNSAAQEPAAGANGAPDPDLAAIPNDKGIDPIPYHCDKYDINKDGRVTAEDARIILVDIPTYDVIADHLPIGVEPWVSDDDAKYCLSIEFACAEINHDGTDTKESRKNKCYNLNSWEYFIVPVTVKFVALNSNRFHLFVGNN